MSKTRHEPCLLGYDAVRLSSGKRGSPNGASGASSTTVPERSDLLFTSYLAYGEMLAGARKVGGESHLDLVRTMIPSLGFRFLAFDAGAVEPFTILRSQHKVKVADAIHLACAASVGMDLFLTGDTGLIGLRVSGIAHIADFATALL